MPGGVQDATRALLDRIEDRGAINLATAADLGCLRVELEKQAEAVRLRCTALEDTLFDDPFPLLKILSSCFNATLHDEATPIWSTIAETSSPKEVILGLEEILAGIRFSDRDDSDDADSDDSNESDRSETENHEAIRALVTYVRTYRIALTRLETAKADKFYSTAFETIGTVLIHLGIQGKLMSAQTSDLDLDLVEAVWDLACAGASVRDEQQKDRILEPARAFTETTLALLCSTISLHDKANDFFLSRQPRYQFSKPAVPEPAMSLRNEKKRRLWSTYLPRLVDNLQLRFDDMLLACRFSDPLKRIGSFSLLSHRLAFSPDTPLSRFDMDTEPTTPTVLLSATLDTLRKAMEPESPCRIPADDALFFLWWCIDQQENLSADLAVLDENILYPLIEILSSLSAFSPDSQTRFLAFRLVATLVREHTGTSVAGQTLQFTLVKDLLSGSATPAFRTACIEIAKDVLIDQLERSEREPEYESIFLSARCMKELGPIVLAFDPPTLFEQEEVSPEQFVEDSQSDVLQKLNWYYFMLERDRDNKTGIRSTQLMQQANETFLTPLRVHLAKWAKTKAELEPLTVFNLELVETALARLEPLVS